MKKILLLIILIALTNPQVSYAENNDQITKYPEKKDISEKRQEEIKKYKENFAKHKEELKNNLKERQASFEAKLKEHRIEMKEKSQLRREAFKEKVKTIKDEKKKTITERVDANLTKINQQRTDAMSKQLDNMTEILTKLKTKRDTLLANGKNVSAVTTAITTADAAIAAAKTAITTQAGEDYTAPIVDETTLKETFSTIIKQLRTDLTATHKTVADAKQALYNVARALKAIEEVSTPTPTI